MMNILHILAISRTSSFHCRGGFEDHMNTLYSGLAALGHRVSFVTTAHPEEPNLRYKVRQGVSYYFLSQTFPGIYSPAFNKRSCDFMNRFIKKEKVDVLHSQSMGAAWFLKKKFHKKVAVPVVISYHGTNYDEFRSRMNIIRYSTSKSLFKSLNLYLKFLQEKFFLDMPCHRAADMIVATSHQQRSIFEQIYHVPSAKITTVLNGMDVNNFQYEKPDQELVIRYKLQGKKVILALARFVEDKGLQFLLPAFSELVNKRSDVVLLLVGSGPYESALRQLVVQYELESSVIFVGSVSFDWLPQFFNVSDMFINVTIRQNGYDLTLVEAMACERVVIASDIGSHPTLIESGKNGYLIEPGRPSLLAEKIAFVLDHPQEAKRMGERARQTILSSFTDKTMVQETEKVFRLLIKKSVGIDFST